MSCNQIESVSFVHLMAGWPICMVKLEMTRGSFFLFKLVLAIAAVFALLSIAGCAQTGKGKAPPPVVTKG